MKDACSCKENYYREMQMETNDKSRFISAAEQWYFTMYCHKCKTRSTSLKNSLHADDCKCNEGLYLNSVKIIDQSEPGCACQKSWKYAIGGVEATYNGCSETPDWKGAEWCYVEDPKCSASELSSISGSTHEWMRCDTTRTCEGCPPNSQITNQIGPVNNACACNKDHYADIIETAMTCIQCPDDKSALPGSTECECKKGTHYLSDPTTGTCKKCPPEADCSYKSNALLTEIVPKPGYWRHDPNSTDFADCANMFSGSTEGRKMAKKRCCPIPFGSNTSICMQHLLPNANSTDRRQCRKVAAGSEGKTDSEAEAYAGPMCQTCLNDEYSLSGDVCSKCIGGSSIGNVITLLAPIFAVLLLVFVVIFLKADKKKEEAEEDDDGKKKKKRCCGSKKKKKKKKE